MALSICLTMKGTEEIFVIVAEVQSYEPLQEADEDDDEEGEEDEGLGHHDLEHDEHGAEETVGVQVEQETHPEHGRGEGEEVVADFVHAKAIGCVDGVAEGDHAGDEGDGEEDVEGAVEDVPEAEIVPAHFIELADLVAGEAEGEDVEEPFDDVQVAGRVDGVDGASVEAEKDDTNDDLDDVLVHGHAHAIWVEVRPVVRVRFAFVLYEAAAVVGVLHQPSTPQVGNALLVAGASDEAHGMKVDCPFYGIRRLSVHAVYNDAVALEQDRLHEVRHVLFILNYVLSNDLAGARAQFV